MSAAQSLPAKAACIGDRQRDHWRVVCGSPTWRNRGPKGSGGRNAQDMRTVHLVVLAELPLAEGTVVNGKPVPNGAVVHHVPLSPPLHSRGQARKELARLKKRYPSARRIRQSTYCDEPYFSPAALQLPTEAAHQ